MSEISVIIYTDGAALGNPGRGGYGVVMQYGVHRKEISQGYEYTTNNRMELLAAIVSLEHLNKEGLNCIIHSDSSYVVNAITKSWLEGWHKRGYTKIANPDLWKRFYVLFKKYKPKMVWVKGHAGIENNERCDVLATSAARNGPWLPDRGYSK